ncbi:CLUMA_CG005494, isoform A [Clunio marinus]|uniref:CLUMA_CG005494, isoform A n=1 Tax=Clunio marinus TaxID=568069 RepID=A0A1J1I0F2_9DIPT|nr:CLUMA_CG005494, isoform A [Clunio marinus]
MEHKPSNLTQSFDNIPAIDEDDQLVVKDEQVSNISNGMGSKSLESINSYDGSRNGDSQEQEDDVEKARLISQVLELQNTLDDLNQRVDGVKEENLRLKSENMVLGQYIENLMSASSVFSSTSPTNNMKKK